MDPVTRIPERLDPDTTIVAAPQSEHGWTRDLLARSGLRLSILPLEAVIGTVLHQRASIWIFVLRGLDDGRARLVLDAISRVAGRAGARVIVLFSHTQLDLVGGCLLGQNLVLLCDPEPADLTAALRAEGEIFYNAARLASATFNPDATVWWLGILSDMLTNIALAAQNAGPLCDGIRLLLDDALGRLLSLVDDTQLGHGADALSRGPATPELAIILAEMRRRNLAQTALPARSGAADRPEGQPGQA